ncbi:MAG TPA: NAD(P)/FAD-dependent oxidoreductase, partial [Longilinea sp.]|nr:NAD(P)/FAD-dependent oxidoreductase [Longilinea sp.]
MSAKKVIIIGAGIAGLSAGCYLQMNGYETEIFELNNLPGGLCTSWKRKGYTFDGCIHSMGGLNPAYKQNRYWNELIDLNKMQFHYHAVLSQIEDEDGKMVAFHTDPEKLEQELLAIAPEDSAFIKAFVRDAYQLAQFDTQLSKPIELWSPFDYYFSQFRSAPYMRYLIKWGKSLTETVQECKSPLLRKVLDSDFFSHYPAYFLLFSIGHLHHRNAGYPIGGSLLLSKAIEEKYRALGGSIHYNARVTRINVEKGRAVGVTLENGETHTGADTVISAADGYDTIYRMLEGKYVNKKIEDLYSRHPMWPSAVLVSLGISRSMQAEPSQLELWLKEPLVVDERSTLSAITVTVYNFDPTLAEAGKTCVRVILKTDNYAFWRDLRAKDTKKYAQEKERVAKAVIEVLEKRFGNIKKHVEVVDVATPATFLRYTNNWKGSTEGWDWLPGLIPETIKKELPGLKGFYMIGQWTMPGGGIPTAQVAGRDIARILCHKDHKKFV